MTEPDKNHFRCFYCRRIVPNEFGAADDMPEACDDCWCAKHGIKPNGPSPIASEAETPPQP